ncbi:MAG: 50S ribosomal protein L18 [bacterium]
MITKADRYIYRKARVRSRLLRNGVRRPRLAFYRSLNHLYAQVIDDNDGRTLVCASTIEKEVKGKTKSGKNVETAKMLGELMARRTIAAGVKEVCFDRAGRAYHGKVKAFADAAREAGLKF